MPCVEAPLVDGGRPRRHAHCAGLASGERCALRCAPGHETSDEGVLQCVHGNWRRLGECRIATCLHAPVVEHASSNLEGCAGAAHGSICTLACQPGFVPVGELRCAFGRFSAARCRPEHCEALPVVDNLDPGVSSTCAPAASGTTCPVNCGYGRKLSEPLLCFKGEWTRPACLPSWQQQPRCDMAPDIPLAQVVGHCVGMSAGEACNVECDPGYEIDKHPRCVDGAWTPASCRQKGCTDFPAVEHGVGLHHCGGFQHSAKCRLFCDAGYRPGQNSAEKFDDFGPAFLTCHGGSWFGPSCVEDPCDSPPPSNSRGRKLNMCIGTPSRRSCRVNCEPGFVAVAYPVCVRGEWHMPQPELCQEAPCLEAPVVLHALDTSSCTGRASGTICLVQCEHGYRLEGVVRCEKGSWDFAACVPAEDHAMAGQGSGGGANRDMGPGFDEAFARRLSGRSALWV